MCIMMDSELPSIVQEIQSLAKGEWNITVGRTWPTANQVTGEYISCPPDAFLMMCKWASWSAATVNSIRIMTIEVQGMAAVIAKSLL